MGPSGSGKALQTQTGFYPSGEAITGALWGLPLTR